LILIKCTERHIILLDKLISITSKELVIIVASGTYFLFKKNVT